MAPKSQHKRIQNSAFGDTGQVHDWLKDGTFPKIHDAMGALMEHVPAYERQFGVDLGACLGMLGTRALQHKGWQRVHGAEFDQDAVDLVQSMVVPKLGGRLTFERKRIEVRSDEFERWFNVITWNKGVTTVFCRRILPELLVETYGLVNKTGQFTADEWTQTCLNGQRFTDVLLGAGVRYLLVQGRQPRPGIQSNPLNNLQNEIDALGPRWKVAVPGKYTSLLIPA